MAFANISAAGQLVRALMSTALLVNVILLSACGTSGHGSPGAAVRPTPEQAQPTTGSSRQPSECPAAPPVSAGPYTATTVPVRAQQAALTTDVTVPQITGGDPAVRERFDSGMWAALAGETGRVVNGTLGDSELHCGETSRVTRIGAHVVAGVLITQHTWPGGPHPVNEVDTVVIDTAGGQPVRLSEALRDPAHAWGTLGTIAQSLVPADGPQLPTAPAAEGEFAAWAPSPAGLTVYFYVGHAYGDFYPVLLPWTGIQELFDPNEFAILSS